MMGVEVESPAEGEFAASVEAAVRAAADLKIETRPLAELKEYPNNARKITERAVKYVAECIREVGFLNPLVVDKDGVIVCGHVSARAAKKTGLTEVPCVIADDLTEDQVKAFRLADNKTAAMAIWNAEKLKEEMAKLVGTQFTMDGMGFDERMLGAVGEDLPTDGGESGDGGSGSSAPDVKNTSEELDLDGDFGDAAFEHVCPHCGLKF